MSAIIALERERTVQDRGRAYKDDGIALRSPLPVSAGLPLVYDVREEVEACTQLVDSLSL